MNYDRLSYKDLIYIPNTCNESGDSRIILQMKTLLENHSKIAWIDTVKPYRKLCRKFMVKLFCGNHVLKNTLLHQYSVSRGLYCKFFFSYQ